MVQLEKFEKYLIEEFYDDFRSGEMSHKTFTRRVAFIMGSMTAAAAAMTLVGCTPDEVPRTTDPMPTPSPATSSASAPGSQGPATTAVPNAKSPLSVPEGAAGLTTATVTFPQTGRKSAATWQDQTEGRRAPAS